MFNSKIKFRHGNNQVIRPIIDIADMGDIQIVETAFVKLPKAKEM